ncbi:MAG: hypothetical protein ACRDD8_15795 [Bacteroidales bacterium]
MLVAVDGIRLARCIEIGIILSTKEEYVKEFKANDMHDMAELCQRIQKTWEYKPCEEFKSEDHFGYITEWMNFDVDALLEIIRDFKSNRR